MPKKSLQLENLSANDYGTFLAVLKEHREETDSALQTHIPNPDKHTFQNIFDEISLKFTERKQKLLHLQGKIDKDIKDKEEELSNQQMISLRETSELTKMDLGYLKMFKRLLSEELINEETLKTYSLERIMARFVRTGLQPDN